MKSLIKQACLFVLVVFGTYSTANAQNDGWTQYRGPQRGGYTAEKLKTPAEGKFTPKLIWKQEMGGEGFSEILIQGDKIYTMYGEMNDSIAGLEYLICFEAATGKEIWRSEVDSTFVENDGWGHGPRATPCIDGELIFCFSGNGKVSGHDLKDGKMMWQKDLVKEYGSSIPQWGFSSSPIIIDDKLIMEVGSTEKKAYFAFDRTNGNEIWKGGMGGSTYNSPIETTIDGQRQLIFFAGGKIQSLTVDGDTLWTAPMPLGNLIAMPVLFDENKLFFSSIRGGGMVAEVTENGMKEVLRTPNMKIDFNSSVYHNGYIYGYHIAAVRCIDATTGEIKWSKRGFGKGSLIIADDKLLILSDKSKLAIAKASPETYIQLGSVQAMEIGKAWTAPTYHNGRVYVRNLKEIACYQLN